MTAHETAYRTGAAIMKVTFEIGRGRTMTVDVEVAPEHEAEIERARAELRAKFRAAQERALNGDVDAAGDAFLLLTDAQRFEWAREMWGLRLDGQISPQVWGVILKCAWRRGKRECLLLREPLPARIVVSMFRAADAQALMSEPGEYERFMALPPQVTVWRGTSERSRHTRTAFSWTTDRDKAAWFAEHFHDDGSRPMLLRAVVRRSAILAYFDYESEIVINPFCRRVEESRIDLSPEAGPHHDD